jgi:hypothetical protein
MEPEHELRQLELMPCQRARQGTHLLIEHDTSGMREGCDAERRRAR